MSWKKYLINYLWYLVISHCNRSLCLRWRCVGDHIFSFHFQLKSKVIFDICSETRLFEQTCGEWWQRKISSICFVRSSVQNPSPLIAANLLISVPKWMDERKIERKMRCHVNRAYCRKHFIFHTFLFLRRRHWAPSNKVCYGSSCSMHFKPQCSVHLLKLNLLLPTFFFLCTCSVEQ